MKILFTGASSFTGMHFIDHLTKAGHEVVPVFTREPGPEYKGVAWTRVQGVERMCKDKLVNATFGDYFFIKWLREGKFDTLCHHASVATAAGHSSNEFDVMKAVQSNTNNAQEVIKACVESGVKQFIYSDTYSGYQGWGKPAFNPYSLSKTLSAQILEYWAVKYGLNSKRFVIPNPFGPWENERFTTSAVKAWGRGETVTVKSGFYGRDNIPVDLLAMCYRRFLTWSGPIMDPSGYTMRQADFAELFAKNIRERLGLPCELEIKTPQDNTGEPWDRFNTLKAEQLVEMKWSENDFWDTLAEYYAVHVIE